MKDTIDVLLLLDWLLHLGEERAGPADCVGRANHAHPDMFAACRIRLAIRSKCGEAGSRVNATLFIAK